jgi:hypothetical protein
MSPVVQACYKPGAVVEFEVRERVKLLKVNVRCIY